MSKLIYLVYYSQEYGLIIPRYEDLAYEIRISLNQKGVPEARSWIVNALPPDVKARAVLDLSSNVDIKPEVIADTMYQVAQVVVAGRKPSDSSQQLMQETVATILTNDSNKPADARLFKWGDSPLSTMWATEHQDAGRTVGRIFENVHRYASHLGESYLPRELNLCDVCGNSLNPPGEAYDRYQAAGRTTSTRKPPGFEAQLDALALSILHDLDQRPCGQS